MVDMMAIQGAITGLKTATDIAKGLLHLQSLAEVQTKVIDLQSAILAAQSSALTAQSDQFAMIQRVRDLEEEIARVKAWEEEKQRYQLITPWPGCHVYALKESSKGTEPPHWICTQCYENGMKSLLHDTQHWDRQIKQIIQCHRCKFALEIRATTERQYV
jgi:primase-polymerase (primpol)-like protein